MIEIQSASILNIKIYDDDIEHFQDVIEKLLHEIKKPGFKKLFNEPQMMLIFQIAESMGLDLPNKVNITASEDLIK